MGKYKKKLRAEKAKVKLKKKKLPKGQNITDTSFKVKKIVTVEQLKKVVEGEPVSSWNVPLKDLMTHLSHHNKSSRLNALNGIKEIILKYPGVVRGPLLKNTVMKILEMMGDVETKIRSTAVSLLDTLFSLLNSEEMTGFYEILNLHLTCAMTHRHPAVQRDSLKLADVVIKYAPEAIKQNMKVVLVNFIRILSSYKYGAKSEIFLVKGSKKDLEENRIAIFQRLRSVLKICYVEKVNMENVEVPYDRKYFSRKIFVAHFKRRPEVTGILKSQGSLIQKKSSQDREKDFKLVVAQIMPLLFETWSEFCPVRSTKLFMEECALKESTSRLLSLILEIIVILHDASLKFGSEDLDSLFNVNYGGQIVKYFLFTFPYVPEVSEKKSDFMNESVVAHARTYESQNLTLCYLSYRMKFKINNDLRNILDNYIKQSSQIRNTKSEEILSKIFEMVILSPRKHRRLDLCMELSVKCYKHTTNEKFQRRLLQMLSKVITDDVKYRHVTQNVYFLEWISYLAKGLGKSKIHLDVVEIVLKAIQRKISATSLRDIKSHFMDIIKNLPNIEVEGCDDLDGKKSIANILYWCDKEVIEAALKNGVLDEGKYPSDIRSYLINIFNFKLNGAVALLLSG